MRNRTLPSIQEDSIDVRLAKQIIERTKSLFPYPTNIVDANGYMIASTTPERIGSYHEACAIIIKSNNYNELIIRNDDEFIGSKKGISYPIRLNGKIIGAIGLTGEVEKVAGYSKLLQALTELLIENISTSKQAHLNGRAKNSFISRWLSPDFDMPAQDFYVKIEKFAFRWIKQFTLIVLKIAESAADNAALFHKLLCRFASMTDPASNLFITNDLSIIWVTSIGKRVDIRKIAESLTHDARRHEEVALFAGIGKQYTDHKQGYQSYSEALKAANTAEANNPVVDYYDDILNIALDAIPKEMRYECVLRVFRNCTQEEIKTAADFIAMYCACNGSINEIAKQMFMHKNTVQYRIAKINELLGFDIRNTRNLLHLQLVCDFFLRLQK
jgi:carbohydrate diacid regulator